MESYTKEGGNTFLQDYLCKHGNNRYYTNLRTVVYRLNDLMGILNDSVAYLFPENAPYTHISANSVGNYYRIIRKKASRFISNTHPLMFQIVRKLQLPVQ